MERRFAATFTAFKALRKGLVEPLAAARCCPTAFSGGAWARTHPFRNRTEPGRLLEGDRMAGLPA